MFSEKTDVLHPWIFSFSTAATLKIRSRSPKSYQFFVMSQLYISENLVRIQTLVHKILCRQESVTRMSTQMPTPTPMGSTPKSICLPPMGERGGGWGDITITTSTFSINNQQVYDSLTVLSNHKHYQINRKEGNDLGPVVQSVVSLTSSLRVISLTVLVDSIYNILIFFAEKVWVAFALQKVLTFFQQKISAYLRITGCKF